jgi:23S rRNA (cytosine1962-C5)-methyltransferase
MLGRFIGNILQRRVLYAPGMDAPDFNGSDQPRFRGGMLVDFGSDAAGRGRRLEQLGGVLVDRPHPQATGPRRQPDAWVNAAAVFTDDDARDHGIWQFRAALPEPWQVALALGGRHICLEVRPAPSGQLGVFLEQWPQWQWLARTTPTGSRMLSLFGHSGAATLAAATAGADVVHVDASRQACDLARRNASASGLDQAAGSRPTIRWICDDARRFVAREVRRGSRYDGVILDPPSWGHGPKGEAFSIDRDLEPLLDDLARLLPPAGAAGGRGPVLLTCHSPRWHHRRLHDTLAATLGLDPVEAGRLTCTDAAGRLLALGDYARHAPTGSHHPA